MPSPSTGRYRALAMASRKLASFSLSVIVPSLTFARVQRADLRSAAHHPARLPANARTIASSIAMAVLLSSPREITEKAIRAPPASVT